MSEASVPGASRAPPPTIMEVARSREDVVVGDEIVRHKLSARIIHWLVAAFFITALLSGMPIWSPVFGWMAVLFGGLQVCRWLHAWMGVGFAVFSVLMLVQWAGQMRFDKYDRRFSVRKYMSFTGEDPDVGRYNAGQKFFFWAAGVGALALLLSGVVLWWPMSFGMGLRWIAIILHDIAFIAFFAAIVGHIYLGTAAEPGTFQSMTRGTVTTAWARTHHPRWYREVMGERTERREVAVADRSGHVLGERPERR
jgi:formate dehydrogenase subunit gamma